MDGSSHNEKVEADEQRDAYLRSLGLRVLRVRVIDVLQNLEGVVEYLRTTPALRATPPKEGNV